MEPPASPRKPRQPKILPEDETNTPAKPKADSSKPSPKAVPKPRSRKTPAQVDSAAVDDVETALQTGGPQESSASVQSDEPSNIGPVRKEQRPNTEPATLPPTPQVEKQAVETRLTAKAPEPPLTVGVAAVQVEPSVGKRAVAVLRTLTVRNIEIARKSSRRAGQAVNGFMGNVSQRVSATQIGGKPIQEVVRETGSNVGKQPGLLLTRLQERLEQSDAAVFGTTLFLIVACILLTLLAVYLWNHY